MSRLTERLLSLKASQLRHIAFLLGLPSTGTKAELSHTIQPQLLPQSPPPKQPNRILSIDMGIKNLGLCVLESTTNHCPSSSNHLKIKILDWRRINLLSSLTLQQSGFEESPQPTDQKLDFSPSVLSQIAVHTTTRFLSTHEPSTILIERQRFRSGGAAAVQEWTLRVNMLESMLWATLECLRRHIPSRPSSSRRPGWETFPETFSVLPARVAQFWVDHPPGFGTVVPDSIFNATKSAAEDVKPQISKVVTEDDTLPLAVETKKQRSTDIKTPKIALVQSWLNTSNIHSNDSPTPKDTDFTGISLEISPAVQDTAAAFLHGPEGLQQKGFRKARPAAQHAKFKRDDLADSLLQGVAWLRWRENERVMRDMLKDDLHF